MKPAVLVTRPQPGAEATARRLDVAGYRPILLPLTEIVPLAATGTALLREPDLVVATSANALRHLPEDLAGQLRQVRLLAVGAQTGRAARDVGFAEVVDGPGNAADLADLVLQTHARQSAILYLSGRVRSDDFETAMESSGNPLQVIEIYDTRPVDHDPEVAARTIGKEPIAAVLLYSAEAARLYSELVARPSIAGLLGDSLVLCLSKRVADAFAGLDWSAVRIAQHATDVSLLSLLAEEIEGRRGAASFQPKPV